MRLFKTSATCALGAAMAAALLAVTPAAQAEETVRINMPSTFPSRLVILGSLGVKLTETVDAISGGELQLIYHEPGALVPPLEVFDAAANGSVGAAWWCPDTGPERTWRWPCSPPCRSAPAPASTSAGCTMAAASS